VPLSCVENWLWFAFLLLEPPEAVATLLRLAWPPCFRFDREELALVCISDLLVRQPSGSWGGISPRSAVSAAAAPRDNLPKYGGFPC
jgi:hypothetical protein